MNLSPDFLRDRGSHLRAKLAPRERALWMRGCIRAAEPILDGRRSGEDEASLFDDWSRTVRAILAVRDGTLIAREWDALSNAQKRDRLAVSPLSFLEFRDVVQDGALLARRIIRRARTCLDIKILS